MTTPHPIPDEVLQAAERMKRCHAGENPYFVYAPEKFGKSWSLDDENRFQRIRREDYETLARAFVAALSHQAEPVSDAKCPRDHDKDGNCDRHPFGCPSYAELDRQNGEWRKIVNSLREQDTKQSAEIARLERENATYHADATEAVQLMIEAQKKRDEFRRAANEAKRELAAITAATAEKDAEIAKLEIDRDNWQASFTLLQAELAEAKGGSAR